MRYLNKNVIIMLDILLLVRAECVRMNVVRVLADIVPTKVGIIGANVVHAYARFPCEGRRSGH